MKTVTYYIDFEHPIILHLSIIRLKPVSPTSLWLPNREHDEDDSFAESGQRRQSG